MSFKYLIFFKSKNKRKILNTILWTSGRQDLELKKKSVIYVRKRVEYAGRIFFPKGNFCTGVETLLNKNHK